MISIKPGKPAAVSMMFMAATLLVSCIPGSRLKDCTASLEKCRGEQTMTHSEVERLDGQLKQCEEQLQGRKKDVDQLRKDTARLQSLLDGELMKNEQLARTNELLLKKNNEFLAENRVQTEKIATELSAAQEQLIRKEDALKKMEADLLVLQGSLSATEATLKQRESHLNRLEDSLLMSEAALKMSQDELERKQQKLFELQRVLAQKDSTVEALKKTVSDALLGFTDKGLKVEERNGKVYVSMDNKLLFASGSTVVGADGQRALAEIANVLRANPEINVLVEGHTDDVPLKGSGQMKDNWDLSVLRATEIVRIILSGGNIDPVRITAAGRSQYLPVDPAATPEARAKNRRTEIILTPKLDELFRVIESN